MPVNLELAAPVAVAGVQLASVAAGVKRDGSDDLLLIALSAESTCAAVFTQSAFAAAPVTVARDHLARSAGGVRALLVNAGNANAGTGEPGIVMARGHCAAVAEALDLSSESVLPFSTGVIGQLLPDDAMRTGIAAAARALRANSVTPAPAPAPADADADARHATGMNSPVTTDIGDWRRAASAIMTTDTVPKLTSRTVTLGGGEVVTLTGMAKGAGMIEPHMATMLAYVFTDARIEQTCLQRALEAGVTGSFNAITVDGDTSTNDACVLCATACGASLSTNNQADWATFTDALDALLRDLSHAIVRDAEGATKFITVRVAGGRDRDECRRVGYAIANSPLVKTAMFASDANVGRLLMAIGKAGIEGLDANAVRVSLGDVLAFEQGGIAAGYNEEAGAAVMAEPEILVAIDLGRGDATTEVFTSDLSHAYVSINADYRS